MLAPPGLWRQVRLEHCARRSPTDRNHLLSQARLQQPARLPRARLPRSAAAAASAAWLGRGLLPVGGASVPLAGGGRPWQARVRIVPHPAPPPRARGACGCAAPPARASTSSPMPAAALAIIVPPPRPAHPIALASRTAPATCRPTRRIVAPSYSAVL